MLREYYKGLSFEIRPHTLLRVDNGVNVWKRGNSSWLWIEEGQADPYPLAEGKGIAIFDSPEEAREAARAAIDAWLAQ
jgi:hypothetical protein